MRLVIWVILVDALNRYGIVLIVPYLLVCVLVIHETQLCQLERLLRVIELAKRA